MNLYKQQLKALDPTTTGGGAYFPGPTFPEFSQKHSRSQPLVPPHPTSTTSSLTSSSVQPPSSTSSVTTTPSYNSFVKKEEDGTMKRIQKNNEFCTVLCQMIYGNNLPFNFVGSEAFLAYNGALYDYIMKYQTLPILPTRKVVSGTMLLHVFDMQQKKIREVCYIFFFYMFLLYVFV